MKIELDIKLMVGHITYENIETGYWALHNKEDDIKYRIKNIPEQLQKENLKIAAIAQLMQQEVSIYMSGETIKLLDYKIL